MIYFSIFSMMLSSSHDLNYKFDKLILLNLSYFFIFLMIIFIILSFNTCWLRIKFHNLFQFLFIGLSWSYSSNCGFGRLTRVGFDHFYPFFIIFFQIHHLTLDLLEIEFCNVFCFVFYRFIIISWLVMCIGKLICVDLN